MPEHLTRVEWLASGKKGCLHSTKKKTTERKEETWIKNVCSRLPNGMMTSEQQDVAEINEVGPAPPLTLWKTECRMV